MKKLRFKRILGAHGEFIGKIKTFICRTQKGFDRKFTSQSKKRLDKAMVPPQPKVKPFLNTAMMAVYDREDK